MLIQELALQDRIKYSKEESSSWIKFGSSQDGDEDFQEKIFKKT